MAEIGFVGKAPSKYQLYLGGNVASTRLNWLYKDIVKNRGYRSRTAAAADAVCGGTEWPANALATFASVVVRKEGQRAESAPLIPANLTFAHRTI